MLVNGTKNITFDLKINYRIIQSIQFFSSKVLTNLDFIEEYLNEISNVINVSTGHNINFYDIFQLLKRNFFLLLQAVNLYINTDPDISREQVFLNNIIPLMSDALHSFRFFLDYLSKMWYGAPISVYNIETYEITETETIIGTNENKKGLINLMNDIEIYYISLLLNIFSKIFQDFIGFLVSIFTKLDNKSEFISVLTRQLIPSFIQNLNLIANMIQFSFFDFEIIRNNKIDIFTEYVSIRFRNRIQEIITNVVTLNTVINQILLLL